MIRLLLVDDHMIFRESLRTILEREPDIAVVGEASDGETALALARELLPDLVLMDVSMPGLNGIEATLQIVNESLGVRVLALTTHQERRFVAHMLNAGALGYVSKAAGRDELIRAIRTVMAGKRYLSEEIATMLDATPPDKASQAKLGRREIAVLKLIAQGQTSPDIAKNLYIALGTVEVHRHQIMQKLDLHSIAELTQYAIREHLIVL
ncbi:MAG: DNA-binding response regulator [Rhodocyclaceae bacterium]|nr:MAG: DNA-binding response regulator [Rhodocyclaceae bacterium]